jgi:hypothetical protein
VTVWNDRAASDTCPYYSDSSIGCNGAALQTVIVLAEKVRFQYRAADAVTRVRALRHEDPAQ